MKPAGKPKIALVSATALVLSCLLTGCSHHPIFATDDDAAVAVQEVFGTCSMAELPASFNNPNIPLHETHIDGPKDSVPGFSSAWHFSPLNDFMNTWFSDELSKDYCAAWGVRRDSTGELFAVWGTTSSISIDATTAGYDKGKICTDYFDRKVASVQDELRSLNDDERYADIQVKYENGDPFFVFMVKDEDALPLACELISKYDELIALNYNTQAYERRFSSKPMLVDVYVGNTRTGQIELSGSPSGRLSADDVSRELNGD